MDPDNSDEGIDSDSRETADDNKENDSYGIRGNKGNLFLDLCLRVPFGIGFVNSKKCLKQLTQTSSDGICIVQDSGGFLQVIKWAPKSRLGKKLNAQRWEHLWENALVTIKLRAKGMAVFWNHLKILNR